MFHKNARHSAGSGSPVSDVLSSHDSQHNPSTPTRLVLVVSGGGGSPQSKTSSSSLAELVAILSTRCASFLAEAAVLVFVLALLDRYMAKGRLELSWIASAVELSLALLAASVANHFGAKRWLRTR